MSTMVSRFRHGFDEQEFIMAIDLYLQFLS
jgi:hypothetical protein